MIVQSSTKILINKTQLTAKISLFAYHAYNFIKCHSFVSIYWLSNQQNMEEIEVPTEHLHETIKEKAEEMHERSDKRWTMQLAISTALMAVFAALGSLFAGHHSNEALIEQIKSADIWAQYQSKSVKAEIVTLMKDLHVAKDDGATVDTKLAGYKKDQETLKRQAEAAEAESEKHLSLHVTLARAVTIFQISIAISAIAMLTGRKFMWYGSMALSIMGLVLFFMGMR